ncbi:MAG: NUDIX domain-containing protein [Armatimonadetes bacterium]|nr:NUDIX domain-containing protein [Armatimonadota bacterium]NIM23895.1 NUDIX domain-containing protein [Armatimonadota bacterium]NIM66614.1 NUDIX domain-containing protein [Armatimonadota bacterium]NIM76282.1 NUDIX domain-containing protein [Armatimonadota bacterium]NIN05976.1 NUDIX domain-containing protein [Armatimonadota bacterium]
MSREYSAGCIVFKLSDKGPLFAFMLDRFGRWTFPKGHIEEGETAFAAARRELKEEVGLAEIELTTCLGKSRHSFDKNGERIDKATEWFLVRVKPEAQLKAADAAHVKAAEWLSPDEALSRLSYTDLKPLLHLANKILKSLRA